MKRLVVIFFLGLGLVNIAPLTVQAGDDDLISDPRAFCGQLTKGVNFTRGEVCFFGKNCVVRSSGSFPITERCGSVTWDQMRTIKEGDLKAWAAAYEGEAPPASGGGSGGGSGASAAGPCSANQNLLSFPTWYKYLNPVGAECEPQIRSLTDVWLIAAAILEILLRLGALLAVGFIIWAGFRFLTSQGDPNTIKESRDTILNAVIGLIITIFATISVNYLAGRF